MLIPTTKNVKTITDMRQDALGLLKNVEEQGLTYIFHRTKPKAVMLPIEDFLRIQEIIEDYLDQKEAEKLAREDRGKGTALEEIAKKYV